MTLEKIEEKVEKVVIGSKRFFLYTVLTPVIFWLVMAIVYYFAARNVSVSAIKDVNNEKILEIFKTYYLYLGVVLGFLSMLGGLIVYLILKLTRLARFKVAYPILVALMALPWYFFGRQLVYFEKRYTDIGRAVISFVGEPLLLTAKIMLGIAVVWLLTIIVIWIIKKGLGKKASLTAVVLLCPLLLTGCVGDLESAICLLMGDDADHCYQGAAVQEGDPYGCEKIEGEGFQGSNPPRDKCYLQIAENTGDLDVCDKIKGGLMSYTREECILGASIKNENPSGCKKLKGADYKECVNQLGPKIDVWKVLGVDDQIKVIEDELKNGSDPELEKQLQGLKTMKQDMLDIASSKTKDDYKELSDPLNREIAGDYATGEIDKETKENLYALNKNLKAQGLTLSEEQYEKIKDYYKFVNDPENDIENMDDDKIVKSRWNEKLGNAVNALKFWKANDTETEKALDQQLLFYSRMLERQEAILNGQSELEQDIERNVGIFAGTGANIAQDKAQEYLLKALFGEATESTVNITTKVIGEALDTVKAEAKSKEFRGLVRAYNMGMEEELAKAGGDVNKAHENVIKNLTANPYNYEDQNTFAKYGNLIENKDCDGSNPHCLNKEVFWKAMKKSYNYQRK
ncbi:MAG: hypothetical protein PHT51_04210 [Patescibacteria group bacterium]|nr:hypothetical protein [Patescibacteria group bacterium]MDD4610925.1 hypothetical protein [Patescibacteria group bacterium]